MSNSFKLMFNKLGVNTGFSEAIIIKLRMEMGNVSKRQQPNQRAENIRRPLSGSSTQRENLTPGDVLKLAPKQKCVLVKLSSQKLLLDFTVIWHCLCN